MKAICLIGKQMLLKFPSLNTNFVGEKLSKTRRCSIEISDEAPFHWNYYLLTSADSPAKKVTKLTSPSPERF